jgi:hypothetical protein
VANATVELPDERLEGINDWQQTIRVQTDSFVE